MKRLLEIAYYYWYFLVVAPIEAMWEYKTIFWYRAWKKEHNEKIRRGDFL